MKKVFVLGLVLLFGFAGLSRAAGQVVTDDMFSLMVEPAGTTEVAPGSTVEFTVMLSSEAEAVQGWSLGLCFDDSVITVSKVADSFDFLLDGTDAASVKNGSAPDMAFISGPPDLSGGITVGVVIDMMSAVTLPPVDNFSILKVPFEVVGQPGSSSEINICDSLGDPTVESVVVSHGASFSPATQTGAMVQVSAVKPSISIVGPDNDLCADTEAETQVKVELGLPADAGAGVDIEGWSYGISHDGEKLELVDIVGSDVVNQLNGGNPPDFQGYNINPAGGSGGTVGVAISLTPDFHVLSIAPGESVHTETFVYRSTITLQEGDEPVESNVSLVHEVLGDPVVPASVSIDSQDIELTLGSPATVTLVSCGAVTPPLKFQRGDANNDSVVNIADGIWILSYKFRGGAAPPCLDAADANDDGVIDQTDAITVIYYRLLGGDPPAAPFGACGTDPSDTDMNNPEDGLSCMVTGANCQ